MKRTIFSLQAAVAAFLIALLPLGAQAQLCELTRAETLGSKPRLIHLGGAGVVRAALSDGLEMRSAVNDFLVQAQRLSTVARAEFSPKLGTSASTLRGNSTSSQSSQSSLQRQVALDLNWRLRTGANVKVSQSRGLTSQQGQLDSSSGNVGVTVTQPLLKGASRVVVEAGLEGSESAFRVGSKMLAQTAQTIAVQALNAYLSTHQAQAATVQARQAFALAVRLHEQNKALVDAGRSPRLVLLRSESDVSAACLDIKQANNAQRQSIRALAQVMGQSNLLDDAEVVLTDTFESEAAAALPEEEALIAAALKSSATLFVAKEAVTRAETALAVAHDGLRLPLGLTASSTTGQTNAGSAVSQSQNWSVGLSLEYAFDRAPLRLEKITALKNLDIAGVQLQVAQRQVRDAATDALRTLTFAREQSLLSRAGLELAEKQLDAEVTRQSFGRTSQLELSNALQALAASRRQVLSAAQQIFRNQLELMRLDGSLLQVWGVQSLLDGWLEQAEKDLIP